MSCNTRRPVFFSASSEHLALTSVGPVLAIYSPNDVFSTSNYRWFLYCFYMLCGPMFPEGGGHVFYRLPIIFSVALFTLLYVFPVIICGGENEMMLLENDVEQCATF